MIVPGEPIHRYAVGLRLTADCQRLDVSLLRCQGYRLAMNCAVADGISALVPHSLARQIYEHRTQPTALAARTQLIAEITEFATERVQALLSRAGSAAAEVRAIGVHGLGVWDEVDADVRSYHSLCNTALMAETTGMNVIDEFPARDLAQHGSGGPVEAAGLWLLLGARELRPGRLFRGVVQLSRTLQTVVLPSVDRMALQSPIWARVIGPGTQLLDELTSRLTRGQQTIDVGGHLAVQGRRIGDLYNEWLDHPTYHRSTWSSQAVSPTPLICDALNRANERNWSVVDILCTANHVLAEILSRTIKHEVPRSSPVGELILAGGGTKNGLLLREIRRRLPELSIRMLDEFQIEYRQLLAGSIAALAMLHIDQVLVAPTTGADVPRLRGYLTPGNPTNWHRLLTEMHMLIPRSMVLRNAV